MAVSIPEDPNKPVEKVPKVPTGIKKIPVDPRRQEALKKKFKTPHQQHMEHLNHENHMKQNVAKTGIGKSGFKFKQ